MLGTKRWDSGCEPNYGTRLAMVFEMVAMTIGHCMPRGTACSRWFGVEMGSDRVGVAIPASLL